MEFSCVLAGVGGQGTVLASKLIALAAMENGEFVRTAETIGMAQRGGSVVSHVRVGKAIHSPLVPKGKADILIGFEPGEAVRNLPLLKKGGLVIIADKGVKPVSDSLGKASYSGAEMVKFLSDSGFNPIVIDTDLLYDEIGSLKALNICLLGAAAGIHAFGFEVEELKKAIEIKTPKRFLDMNMKALNIGLQAAQAHITKGSDNYNENEAGTI